MTATENSIYVSDKAREKVRELMEQAGVAGDASYFLRVGVVGGGAREDDRGRLDADLGLRRLVHVALNHAWRALVPGVAPRTTRRTRLRRGAGPERPGTARSGSHPSKVTGP